MKDKIASAETNPHGWFEPAIRFVEAAKSATFLAENGSEERKRDFLKKIGSNQTISDRHLSVTSRGAWQLVGKPGPFAQYETTALVPGAAFIGETDHVVQPAERAGNKWRSSSYNLKRRISANIFGYTRRPYGVAGPKWFAATHLHVVKESKVCYIFSRGSQC